MAASGSPSSDRADVTALRTRDDVPVQHRLIHGHRRAFRLLGSGPALLLLHGIGDSSHTWVPLMRRLARRYTVLAPDLLGHGDSDKPRADYSVAAYANGMRDLMDVLGIEAATIVGHSLGGGVAAQIAYQYPERCERLVLVSSGGVAHEVNPILRLATVPGAGLVMPVLQWPIGRIGGNLLLSALRALGTDLGRDADELRAVFDGLPDGDSRGAFTRTVRSVVDWRGQVVTMRDRCYLAEDVPVLLVWGAHDAIIPVEHARLAHDAMPQSHLSIYPEAGHFPHHTDPTRFLRELNRFISTTQPARHRPERRRELLASGRPSAPIGQAVVEVVTGS